MAGTRVDTVYADLRAAVIRGEFEPGSKLKVVALAKHYDASLTVLREVLTKLAGDGLVVASPRRGFSVMELSLPDLRDLTRARTLIETAALRESVRTGDVSWEAQLLAAHHTLTRTVWKDAQGIVRPEWAEAHNAFHVALFAACGSGQLISIANDLRQRAELYLWWSQKLGTDPERDVAGEHQAILDRALARDAEEACAELAAHIERSTTALVRYAEGPDSR